MDESEIEMVDITPPGSSTRLFEVRLSPERQARLDVGSARLPGGSPETFWRWLRRKTLVVFGLGLVLVMCAAHARADDQTLQLPQPENDILPLHRGQAAPRDGLLVDSDDMLHIQQEYVRLQFQLGLTQQRDQQVCDLRVHEQRAITQAGVDRLALTQSLWQQRQQDLVTQLSAARRDAERGVFENPLLWFVIGAATTAIVVIAILTAK